jgi:hypothetical protein
MAVHYKFVSSRDYDTVKFDGGFITVADLKLAISAQKKLGLATLDGSGDMDLLITNATTGEGPFGAVSLRLSLRLAHEPNGRTAPRSLELTHVPDAFLLGLLQSTWMIGSMFRRTHQSRSSVCPRRRSFR